jgi:pimeloyl-ACP methyl ester carboxylesterase
LRRQIRAILEEGIGSEDPTIAEVARTALGKIDNKAPHLRQFLTTPPPSRPRRRESNTAVITHGTWGADQTWYQPQGEFHAALGANRPDLDIHDQSFVWSGGYSHTARTRAADELKQWIGDQGLSRPDFFAHSHGGTVANFATRDGVEFDRLVLLAWPVRTQWGPDVARIDRLIDIRVKLDFVILIDGGGQRFPGGQPKLEEHRNGWFDHSAPHEEDYWDDHDLWSKL